MVFFISSAAFYLKKSTKEIAVVGFSNSLFSTIIKPNLSGIDQPEIELVKLPLNT
jgi:DNA-binding LacI/PurR family transcriptional regulator